MAQSRPSSISTSTGSIPLFSNIPARSGSRTHIPTIDDERRPNLPQNDFAHHYHPLQ
ncbi:uncharacterized protein LACBIDRAFT_311106 [Laccaria bicolor S238N-H82]|uniref:Predicted protein n=1 Tax=Laccaria bicolor (strain S238N-H82 / ATCC MYA-4686) TaxID=486041 RepID=B0CZ92_LACBS|nr:uncharacterized protein LACBIDRAFT_311106 [Laccaria bicolor S238N-H82]EDR12110.1 predicted protein [Laccaria bicolor S238N-H82]|eukprot:XP_001876374.1 predicted protein [Laccaria bicolor S238N-H82]